MTITPPTSSRRSFRYEPLPDLDQPLAARLGRYPRTPDLLFDCSRALARTIAAGSAFAANPFDQTTNANQREDGREP